MSATLVQHSIGLLAPSSGDVLDLILADHRRFEALLRELRDNSADRAAVRREFAALHIAHAEAEEDEVYPSLRHQDAIGAEEADHGEEEHAEANQALLDVLESPATQGKDFDDRVEELARLVNHHLAEEELTILNPARSDVSLAERRRLGAAFARTRNALIQDDCGSLSSVRAAVADARDKGLIEG